MRFPAATALERIREKKLSAGYILLGRQLYWRDRILEALREVLGPELGETGIVRLDLRHDSLNRVLEKAQERNLWAPRQLLIVSNAQGLVSRRRAEAPTSPSPAQAAAKRSDELAAYFRDPNPCSLVVFEMLDLDLDSTDWREREKIKARLEAFGRLCDVALLASPSFEESLQLVRGEAAERGQTISREAAERLITAFHGDLGRIRMEIEKLCLYNPEQKRIEEEDVDRGSPGLAGTANRSLPEAIGSGNLKEALEELAEVEQSGRYAPLVILEVVRYLRQLALLREQKVLDPRRAAQVLWAARLPAPQSSLPKLIQQTHQLDLYNLLRSFKLAHETEIALRSGPPAERVVLERFVVKLLGMLAG